MRGIDIADIDFEAGDLSDFDDTSTGAAATTVSAAAALAGTGYGLEVDAGANTTVRFKKSIVWVTADELRMRCHLDPNGVVLATTTTRRIFSLLDDSNTNYGGILFRDAGGGTHQISALVRNDAGSTHTTSWYTISDADHFVEILITRASSSSASDGTLTLWIDGVEQEELTGLDVYDVTRPDTVALEWTAPNASDTGTFYIDELVVRNEDVEIGPVELSMVLAKAGANAGDNSEFDTFDGGGDISVSAAAALAGSEYGIAFVTDSGTDSSAVVNFARPWVSRTIRFRFHFDPNGVTLADTNLRRIAALIEPGVGNRSEAFLYSDGGGGYEVAARATEDGGNSDTANYAISDAEHHIEVVLRRATSSSASDGELELWVDDVLKETLTGLDIWDISRPTAGRLSWVSGSGSDAGTVYGDELEVRDRDGMIGSAVSPVLGPLSIEVDGTALSYVVGRCTRTDRVGASAGTFIFQTDDRPVEEGEVDVDITWKDEAGNINRTEKFFGGHILRVRQFERQTSRKIRYEVHCVDFRHEAAFTFVTDEFTRGNIEDVMADLAELLPGGYTLDVDDGPLVGPFDWEDTPWPQAAAEAARDAGFLFWIDQDRVVHVKDPDTLDASFEINRDDPDERWWKLDYQRAQGKIVNTWRVYGAEGKIAVAESKGSQDVWGERPNVYSATSVINDTALATIGSQLVAALKMPVVRGSVSSSHDRIDVGVNTWITDLQRKGVKSLPVRVESYTMKQLAGEFWRQSEINFTSERLLGRLNPRPPLPTTEIHGGPVREPTTNKSPSSGEYIVQVKYKVSTGVVTLRLSSTKSDQILHGFRVVFEAAGNLTVSRALTGTDAGEDVEILDSGTSRVDIASTVDGKRHGGRWAIQNETKSVAFTITGDLEDAEMRLTLRNGEVGGVDADEINGVYFGKSQIIGVRDMRRRIDIKIGLSPTRDAQVVVDGALSGELAQAVKAERDLIAGYRDTPGNARQAVELRSADGINTLVEVEEGYIGAALRRESGGPALNRSFAKSSSSDPDDLDAVPESTTRKVVGSGGTGNMDHVKEGSTYSRPRAAHMSDGRIREIRRSGGVNIDADDVFDYTREDTTDITEASNIEFVNGTYTDASRRPTALRRSSSDVDADDLSKHTEVEQHLGGLNEPSVFNSALNTELVDRDNDELQNVHVLNNCDIGNPDGSEESSNVCRAGAVRGIEISDSAGIIYAYLTEGDTAVKSGASTYGFNFNGDGNALTADSGVSESGGGTGETGGGDRGI